MAIGVWERSDGGVVLCQPTGIYPTQPQVWKAAKEFTGFLLFGEAPIGFLIRIFINKVKIIFLTLLMPQSLRSNCFRDLKAKKY